MASPSEHLDFLRLFSRQMEMRQGQAQGKGQRQEEQEEEIVSDAANFAEAQVCTYLRHRRVSYRTWRCGVDHAQLSYPIK